MAKNPIRLLITMILVSGIYMSGCATTAQKTGYLRDYEKMKKGKYLENYWSNNSLIKERKYSKIIVEPIDIERIVDQKGIKAENCRDWMQNALIKAARPYGDSFAFGSGNNKTQIRLQIAITMMTPGSAGGRIFAGELGMGHAWVQIEGRVIDIESDKEIAFFSDFRRSSGMIGLRDIGGDAGPTLVRELIEKIASDLVLELKDDFAF